MKILMDTHYLLWTVLHSARMEPWAKELIGDVHNEIQISAASLYEISLKVRLGKLREAAEFESDLVENVERVLGFRILPLEAETMVRAARFAPAHADPFDRMIAAHAVQWNLPLLSVDARMDGFGVRRLSRALA